MELITTRSDWGSHSYILKHNNQAIIIDAGTRLKDITKFLDNVEVVGILLTHLHYDHTYYLLQYVEKFKCNVYLFDPSMTADNTFTLDYKAGGLTLPKDCYVKILGNTHIGNFNVYAIHTPGHCTDSMCYVIDNMLFSGDTIFDGCIGRIDLFNSSRDEMIESLKKISKLKFDICYAGHGRCSSYADIMNNINYHLSVL